MRLFYQAVEPNVDLLGFAATSKTTSVCSLIHNVILSMNRDEMYGKVICHYGIFSVRGLRVFVCSFVVSYQMIPTA